MVELFKNLIRKITTMAKNKTQPAPKILSTDEKKVMLQMASNGISNLIKEYGIEVGVWLTRKQIEELYMILKQTPNITEWKLDLQLRKD